jgi:hypothetical protein
MGDKLQLTRVRSPNTPLYLKRYIDCLFLIYYKQNKKPRSRSLNFLFKIFQTRDIIYSEKEWDLLWRKPKIGNYLLTVHGRNRHFSKVTFIDQNSILRIYYTKVFMYGHMCFTVNMFCQSVPKHVILCN